ncbi:hypothetical protein [Streptomyces sp. NBC_00259]|uniref:hypothetical protein n=1 Tax=Streptomyces sp. NBC_00259 TaxID=2903643 RepID=UPI002E2DB4F5|nr:hypothetical protein [Streptomyces sp. NBC_00259]
MTLNKKGSRRIVVDGIAYRWRIRRKPSCTQGLCWTPLVYAVGITDSDRPGRALVVTTGLPHPGNWVGVEAEPVPPAHVAAAIKEARAQGWDPSAPGSPFLLNQAAGFVRLGLGAEAGG